MLLRPPRTAERSFNARSESRPQTPLDSGVIDDATCDLLDRAFGRVDVWNSEAPEQRFRGAHLVLHLLRGGVAACGSALVADLAQPLRTDGEAVELRASGREPRRQLPALEVLVRQRIVRREDAVLQRHVEAGRGLAGARYPHQHHIRARVIRA